MALHLSLELTNICNLSCLHCQPESGCARPNELSYEALTGVIDHLATIGLSSVNITGGEPFLYPNFCRFLQFLNGLDLRISTITNGTICTPKHLSLIVDTGCSVVLSLESNRAEINDMIRGEGSFAKALRNSRRFLTAGIPLSLAVSVGDYNAADIEAICVFAKEHGFQKVSFMEVGRQGRADQNWEIVGISPANSLDLQARVTQAAQKHFEDDIVLADTACWVDGSSLYMDSEGHFFLCAEVFQRWPERYIAQVSDRDWLQQVRNGLSEDHSHKKCCYDFSQTTHVTIMQYSDRPCVLGG